MMLSVAARSRSGVKGDVHFYCTCFWLLWAILVLMRCMDRVVLGNGLV